jgi:Flp pilus assembly protein TadB
VKEINTALATALTAVVPLVIVTIIIEFHKAISSVTELTEPSFKLEEDIKQLEGERSRLVEHLAQKERSIFQRKKLMARRLLVERDLAKVESLLQEKEDLKGRILGAARDDQKMTLFYIVILVLLVFVELVCLGEVAGVVDLPREFDFILPAVVCGCLILCIFISMSQYFFLVHYAEWVYKSLKSRASAYIISVLLFLVLLSLMAGAFAMGMLDWETLPNWAVWDQGDGASAVAAARRPARAAGCRPVPRSVGGHAITALRTGST